MGEDDEGLDEEGRHIKDVCAYFGSASYAASCVETGLAIALMQCDLLMSAKAEYDAGKPFDQEAYEKAFDQYMEAQHKLSLGQLIKKFKEKHSVPNDLEAKLFAALKRRNYVAHHFFRERAVEFATAKGRDLMIAELRDAEAMFNDVDQDVQREMDGVLGRLGINRERMERQMEAIKQQALRDADQ